MSFDLYALPTPDLGLRCRICGYPLAGLGAHRCPECGTTFDYEEFVPPGDFPMLIFDGKEAVLTPDVADTLRRAKIPFIELIGPAESMYGLHSVTHSKSRFGVPRNLYFDAVYFLREAQRGAFPLMDDSTLPDWVCPRCREENPGTFELCWKCEAPRPVG